MKAEQFVFWLQGFIEISLADSADALDNGMSSSQVECIRKHLNMVFAHDIDPKAGGKAVQDALNKIHHGPFPTPNDNTLIRC